jgi:hypothetical protein
MRAAVSGFAPPSDSPIFSLQDPEKLLTSAAPPIGALVSSLTAEQRAAVQQALDDMFRQRFGGGLAVLNMQVHIGIGTK